MRRFFLCIGLLMALAPAAAQAQTDPNAGLEALVRSSFADIPEMIPIAKCESGFRQFASAGVVLRGGPQKQYVGLFQIDEPLHTAHASNLGFDILTPEGNIAYARRLFTANGTRPWRGCVKAVPTPKVPGTAAVPGTSESSALTRDLRSGMVDAQVRLLQRMLNAGGFAVAASGPGSPGQETTRFGPLTLEAVRRFQCAKGIVCAGDASTTGYGRVGPRTRAALNALGG